MRTCGKSNCMRLMSYPLDPLDPKNTSFIVMLLERATYGDSCCSCLLEVCLREHVAPRCRTDLGRRIIEDMRFVDDILSGHSSKELLIEAMTDVARAMSELDFQWKHIRSNKLWHTDFIDDDTIDPGEDVEEIFHHKWNYRNDTLINYPILNPAKKVRGSYATSMHSAKT